MIRDQLRDKLFQRYSSKFRLTCLHTLPKAYLYFFIFFCDHGLFEKTKNTVLLLGEGKRTREQAGQTAPGWEGLWATNSSASANRASPREAPAPCLHPPASELHSRGPQARMGGIHCLQLTTLSPEVKGGPSQPSLLSKKRHLVYNV